MALINPRIVMVTDDLDREAEGCLSIPGIEDVVERPWGVRVEAVNPKGEPVSIEADAAKPPVALVFKTISDKHGDLTFIRVYQGTLKPGMQVINARTGKPERIAHLYLMHANERESVEEAKAGQICAAVGLKLAATGDTLCLKETPFILEATTFPPTVISMAIETKTSEDKEKLGEVLQKLAREDPTFRYSVDRETEQLIIYGMGELHLEIIRNRIVRDYGVQANVGKPRVAFRQTIGGHSKVNHKYAKQSGGRGQFAQVVMELEPAPGEGVVFENAIKGGNIPREYIPAVEAGARSAAEGGCGQGYPVIDVKITLKDGKYHEVDSSDMAFNICGSMAFAEAAKAAGLVLLEPIMNLEVTVPAQFLSPIIGDLNSRRASISEIETSREPNTVRATVPLAEFFGYSTVARSLSQGRANYSLEPREYRAVPPGLVEKLAEKG